MSEASINRIIFADKDGTTRSQMAAEIFKNYRPNFDGDILARGVFVSFEEPVNQKAEAVMIADGLEIKNLTSRKIQPSDITDRTRIFTMDGACRDAILESVEGADEENTFTLSPYTGEELDVMDPYGGSLQAYGICYESIKNTIKSLIEIMEKDGSI